MPISYLPQRISAFKTWVLNFSGLLSASPATYGLTAGDAAAVAASYAIFAAAYALSSSLSTRTPVTVAAAQTARNNLTILLRSYVRLILANAGVLDSNKTALGLTIRDAHPTRIPAPGTAPDELGRPCFSLAQAWRLARMAGCDCTCIADQHRRPSTH